MGEVSTELSSEHISQDDVEQYAVIIDDAFTIHHQKEEIRKGLWKDYPAEDQAKAIKIKIDRVLRTLERGEHISEIERENVVEECHDIINYAIFTVRKVKGSA